MRWLIPLVLGLGCAGSPPEMLPVPVASATAAASAPPRAAPRTDADRENEFVAAWNTWATGNREQATGVFRRLVRELVELPTKGTATDRVAGVPSAPLAASSDGARGVAISGDGAYVFDGAGVPLRYDGTEATSVSFIPNSTLAVLGGQNLVVVDATTFGRVFRAAAVTSYRASPKGRVLAFVESPASGAARVHLWEPASRSERPVIPLRAGEAVEPTSFEFSPDERALSATVFGDSGAAVRALFDGGDRIDLPSTSDAGPPSYSADGKWIAFGYPSVTDHGYAGRTLLYDRATRKLVGSSGAIPYPTATRFTNDGKRLIVGDLRRAMILDVPTLRKVATTPFVRPHAGPEDDLQNISDIEIVGADAGFWIQTADSTNGVFKLPSGALVWSGRGARISENGVQRFVDRDEKNVETKIDAAFSVTQRPLTETELAVAYATLDDAATEKLRTILEGTVCTVREKIFPIAACR